MRTSVSGSRVYYRRASDTTARTLEMVSAGKPPTSHMPPPPGRRTTRHTHTTRENVYLSRPTLPRARTVNTPSAMVSVEMA
jgi:hypothetical protein